MKIQNEFTVDATVDEAWALLTDIPTIAPCLPGAKLTGEQDGEYEGTVTVRVGPMTAKYKGTVQFQERDDDAHHAVLRANGRDARGQGTAEATITAQLREVEGGTTVAIDTDLVISGKVAQFGKGVMVDVSEKMLGQFADCLGTKLLGEDEEEAELEAAVDEGAATTATRHAPARTAAQDEEPEPLDLMAVAGGAVGKRAAIGIAVVAGVLLLIALLRRRQD